MIIETKFDLREKVTDELGKVGWIRAIFPDIRVVVSDGDNYGSMPNETMIVRCWVTYAGKHTKQYTEPTIESTLTGFEPREFWNDEKELFETL